jgi:hypothetical protein
MLSMMTASPSTSPDVRKVSIILFNYAYMRSMPDVSILDMQSRAKILTKHAADLNGVTGT